MYRDDQTIKPRGKKPWSASTNCTTPDADFEPDAGDLKTTVLKTFLTTASRPRTSGIYFTEPKNVEEIVKEYTKCPANCPLVCACKGSKAEIAPIWKDPDTLEARGVEVYIPFRAGEQIRGTKVTVFQIGTGDLVIDEMPDYTNSANELKGQHIIIIAEVREGLTETEVFQRFEQGIK